MYDQTPCMKTDMTNMHETNHAWRTSTWMKPMDAWKQCMHAWKPWIMKTTWSTMNETWTMHSWSWKPHETPWMKNEPSMHVMKTIITKQHHVTCHAWIQRVHVLIALHLVQVNRERTASSKQLLSKKQGRDRPEKIPMEHGNAKHTKKNATSCKLTIATHTTSKEGTGDCHLSSVPPWTG